MSAMQCNVQKRSVVVTVCVCGCAYVRCLTMTSGRVWDVDESRCLDDAHWPWPTPERVASPLGTTSRHTTRSRTLLLLTLASRHALCLLDPPLHDIMPPGPAYNWLCVASSLVDILSHSAQIRAAQLARNRAALGADSLSRKRKRDGSYPDPNPAATVVVKPALPTAEVAQASLVQERNSASRPCDTPPDVTLPNEQTVPSTPDASEVSPYTCECGEDAFNVVLIVQVPQTS